MIATILAVATIALAPFIVVLSRMNASKRSKELSEIRSLLEERRQMVSEFDAAMQRIERKESSRPKRDAGMQTLRTFKNLLASHHVPPDDAWARQLWLSTGLLEVAKGSYDSYLRERVKQLVVDAVPVRTTLGSNPHSVVSGWAVPTYRIQSQNEPLAVERSWLEDIENEVVES